MDLLVLLWALCSLIGAYVASQRGYSWIFGLLVGFALGPVGVLIAALLKEDREPRRLPVDERKRCPRCAEWIMVEALICRFCGYSLDTGLSDLDEIAPADPTTPHKSDAPGHSSSVDDATWEEWSAPFPK